MTVTLTPAKPPENAELIPVDTEHVWNAEIFKECLALGCLPSLIKQDGRSVPYYIVHHEQAVLYDHGPETTIQERIDTVKAWLHEDHIKLQALLERG